MSHHTTPHTDIPNKGSPEELLLPSPITSETSVVNDSTMELNLMGPNVPLGNNPEYRLRGTLILRGGFPIVENKENILSVPPPFHRYPPPPNAVYHRFPTHSFNISNTLASQGRPEGFSSADSGIDMVEESPPKGIDGQEEMNTLETLAILFGSKNVIAEASSSQANVKEDNEHSLPSSACEAAEQIPKQGGRTKGEILADTINWKRATWDTTPVGHDVFEFYGWKEARQDFINNIDSGAEFELCEKCEKSHIPPGSPITLQDRDTCGSFLPEWFPAAKIKDPWDTYNKIINELVKLDEIAQGYTHQGNPDQKPWEKEWHENPDPRWKQFGRRRGFWKCRDGPDAPEWETDCDVCHRKRTKEDNRAAKDKSKSLCERREIIMAWIGKQVKEVGEKDKVAVLTRWRNEEIERSCAAKVAAEKEDENRQAYTVWRNDPRPKSSSDSTAESESSTSVTFTPTSPEFAGLR